MNQINVPTTGVGGNSINSSPRNLLLSSLTPQDYSALAPHLRPEDLPLGSALCLPDQPISRTYFLNSGLASTVCEEHGGSNVEVGITGRDGIVGVSVLLGSDRTPNRVFMQIGGDALSVSSAKLTQLMTDHPGLRTTLHKYVYVYLMQVSQTAVCNRIHEVRERLARWLLMSHDRCSSDVMSLTHEFLGIMLGTRRSSVTVAARLLQESGVIEYKHGLIRILDREALERTTCHCYDIVCREYERTFPNWRLKKEESSFVR